MELPFWNDRVQGVFPILGLDPLDQDLKNLVHCEDLAGRQRRQITSNGKTSSTNAGRFRFVQTEVLCQVRDSLKHVNFASERLTYLVSIVVDDSTDDVRFIWPELG